MIPLFDIQCLRLRATRLTWPRVYDLMDVCTVIQATLASVSHSPVSSCCLSLCYIFNVSGTKFHRQQTKVFFQSQFFYLHRETHKRTHAHLLLTFTWVQTCFRAEVQKHTMQLLYGGKASAHSSIYTGFKKQRPERCGLDLPLSSLTTRTHYFISPGR